MKKIIIGLINMYQVTPLHTHSMCRFSPTCSQYMKDAILIHGYKGIWMGIKRIIRCHPFGEFGYDPVPEKKNK